LVLPAIWGQPLEREYNDCQTLNQREACMTTNNDLYRLLRKSWFRRLLGRLGL
jgi:hypothetical protein